MLKYWNVVAEFGDSLVHKIEYSQKFSSFCAIGCHRQTDRRADATCT